MSHSIVVENLGKRFRRFDPHQPKTLQETFLKLFQRNPPDYFWGLKNVNLKISAGRMIGIIGHNGAGKSTLLRLIGGVGQAEEGGVQTHGQIGALLDLGTGFHPDLTGRENVFVSGVIAGLTRRQVEDRFDSIVEFAELEEFIDNPLRTYSSGMNMRLAFAVAIHINPDILLIDEVLAVGDMAFQQKCLERIKQFKEQGCTIILVSHDVNQVQQLCDEVIWLRKGCIEAHGPADVIVSQYKAEMSKETKQRMPLEVPTGVNITDIELRVNENRFGSMEIKIDSVQLIGFTRTPVAQIETGEPLHVEIEYLAPNPIETPIFGVTITREDGFVCYDINTVASGISIQTVQGRGKIALNLERLDLVRGQYYVDVGIYEKNWAYAYDYHWQVYPLIINAPGNGKGVLHLPHSWQVVPQQTKILDNSENSSAEINVISGA